MSEQNGEIEPVSMQQLAPLQPKMDIRTIEESVAQAEKYVGLLSKIRLMSIKLTNNMDWSNQGGKPYLEKSGCDKIASAFGLKIYSPEFTKETLKDDKGEYIMFTCSGEGEWNNSRESEIGACTTRDDFFGKKGGDYKPLSEVDLTDIKKKAFTNLANRLIKKLLGLSFTWEEISAMTAGKISKDSVQTVTFSQGSKGGNTDSPETKKLREEIRTMILKIVGNDESLAKLKLEELTGFMGKNKTTNEPEFIKGRQNVAQLSEKQVQITHGKCKKLIEDFNKSLDEQAAKESTK